MKKFFINKLIILTCVFSQIYANDVSLFKPKNQEEALFLRRIAEFWQDEEFEIVKFQIETYIVNNPDSTLIDPLFALLGNVFLNEKDYLKAIGSYDNIKNEEVKDKIAINLLTSLFQLKWYKRLINECDNYANRVDGEVKYQIIYFQALSYYNVSEEIKNNAENAKLLILAKNKFEELLNSSYSTQAKEYLSQICKSLNEYEKASEYFIQLAEKNFAKEDEYLFQAALLQARFDKEKALNTYNKITELSSSSKAQDASFNKLLLLYELQRFEEITNQKDLFLKKIVEEKLPLVNFFIGRSFYKLNDYESACPYLENALKMEDNTSEPTKLTHIMLMQISYHLNNYELFIKVFDNFLSLFPHNEQIFECYLAKALLLKNNGSYESSKEVFEKIEQTFKLIKNKDKFIFEYAHLLFLMGETENSKIKYKQFIENFPYHKNVKTSIINIINCSIKDLEKDQTQEELINVEKTLASELENLLKTENIFTKKEKAQYTFILAKLYFDLSNYESCINISQNLLKINGATHNKPLVTNEELSEINLLIGLCHKNLNNDLHEFINYAQKSIELSPTSKKHFITYVNLFNSYLNLAKENETVNEKLYQAADCLYKAYKLSPNELSKANLIWLSDYYFKKINKYLNEYYKNTIETNPQIAIYCKNATDLLKFLIEQPSEADYFEEFSNKLAYLFKAQNNLQEEQNLLEGLLKNYRFHPEKIHKYLEKSIYELAKNYENQNMNDKAIELYQEFLASFNKDSPFRVHSLLHLARLQLSAISKENFTSTNKKLEKIISTLKTLSLQKNLDNEPAHLEAALDYVDVVCYMERNDNWEKRLFLLKRLKENFNSEEDIVSQDYKAMKHISNEKEKLYNAYISLVDVEKLICLGFLENNINQLKKAKKLLVKLEEDNLIVTEYLENRIRKNMQLIEDNKLEEK